MISRLEPLPVGNAVRLFFQTPDGASRWKLLRRKDDAFTGADDADARLIDEGALLGDLSTLDRYELVNGTAYFYKLYSFVDGDWEASDTVSATPAADYAPIGNDVQTLVRERLELGLKVEVARGALKPANGKIECLTAPPQFDEKRFPIVVVRLVDESPAARGLGEEVGPDERDAGTGDWTGAEGWLARNTLEIAGFSVNPDVRVALRKSLRSILIANLPVFDDAGFKLVEFTASDVNDFESYGSPVYSAAFNFTCLAPTAVASTGTPINDVEVAVEAP